jgi:hypothetical protein
MSNGNGNTTLSAELIGEGKFWAINKKLAKYLTLTDLVVLMEHVFIYDKECTFFGKDPFIYNRDIQYNAFKEDMAELIGVSEDTIARSERKLFELDLISVSRLQDNGRRNFFTLNAPNIRSLYKNPYQFIMGNERYKLIIGSARLSKILKRNTNRYRMEIKNSENSAANCGGSCPQNDPAINNIQKGGTDVPCTKDLRSLKESSPPVRVQESLGSITTTEQSIIEPPSTRRDELANIKPKKDPISAAKLERRLLPETIELIKFWDSMPNLSKHDLSYSSRTTVRYELQYKYIKRADDILKKLLVGSYYNNNSEIDHVAVKNTAFSVQQIKIAIERFNNMADVSYTKNYGFFQTYKLADFFHKETALFQAFFIGKDNTKTPNKNKYKAKYAFIHCTLFNPTPLAVNGSGHCATTKYPTTVNNVIAILKDHKGYRDCVKDYNIVVAQVEKAITNVKAVANGKSHEIIKGLPRLITNCMSQKNRKLHVDNLYFTVEYNLLPYLREIREI